MKIIDIYVKKGNRYIDVYLDELTSSKEFTAFNSLVLYSVLSKMSVGTPAAMKPLKFAIDTNTHDLYFKIFKELSSNMKIESAISDPTIYKFLDNISDGSTLKSENLVIVISAKISGKPTKLGLKIDSPYSNLLLKILSISNDVGLESSIAQDSIEMKKTIELKTGMSLNSRLLNSSQVFASLRNNIMLGVKLDDPISERVRKFKDLEGTSFSDLTGMNMEEFIILEQ